MPAVLGGSPPYDRRSTRLMLMAAAGSAGLPASGWALPGALAALTAAGLALYHTGIERAWWDGPATCTSGTIAGVAPEDLLNRILAAPVVRCDEVAWSLAGLSMASWNGIASMALFGLRLMAAGARPFRR